MLKNDCGALDRIELLGLLPTLLHEPTPEECVDEFGMDNTLLGGEGVERTALVLYLFFI